MCRRFPSLCSGIYPRWLKAKASSPAAGRLLRGLCDCERTTHGAHWKRRKVKRKNSIGDIIEILEIHIRGSIDTATDTITEPRDYPLAYNREDAIEAVMEILSGLYRVPLPFEC